MNLPIKLNTINSLNELKIKVKGSSFIAHTYPINNEKEVNEILSSVHKKFYDATHNCYAYKLIDGKYKYSDDGEPSGTAGLRILSSINHFNLTNILLVVTRYFGGVKLGVGLLGKAYSECSMECLKNAKIITKILYSEVIISFDYELSNFVHNILSKYKVKILETIYLDKPQIKCLIESDIAKKVTDELNESSHNKVICRSTNNLKYFEIEK